MLVSDIGCCAWKMMKHSKKTGCAPNRTHPLKDHRRQKLQCHYNTGVLGGRGWITQAAHLKRPRRGLFAAGTYSGGPYELRLPIFLQPLGGALKNRSAAPASPPCFRRRRRSAPLLFESTLESETSGFYKTKSPAYFHTLSIFGGRGWIRTTEAEKQQIYSLSPLATREHAHIQFFAVTDCLYILPLGGVFVNCFLQLFQKRS